MMLLKMVLLKKGVSMGCFEYVPEVGHIIVSMGRFEYVPEVGHIIVWVVLSMFRRSGI